MFKFLSICLLLLFYSYLVHSQVIKLENPVSLVDIGLQVELLEDTTQQLTFEQVSALATQSNSTKGLAFVKSTQAIPNYGNTASAIWCKFTVQATQSANWYFLFSKHLVPLF
jgi:hypothetical protein